MFRLDVGRRDLVLLQLNVPGFADSQCDDLPILRSEWRLYLLDVEESKRRGERELDFLCP